MVDERKRKREYKMLKEKLNVKKKIEKLKELDDDEIELMGIQFINKGKHLRAQAFVLKLLFIFNAVLLPSNFFMNIHWIAYVSNLQCSNYFIWGTLLLSIFQICDKRAKRRRKSKIKKP